MGTSTIHTIGIYLSPAFLTGAIFYVNNSTCTSINKRIDGVRQQMQADHERLWNKIYGVEKKLDAHIGDQT